MVLNNNRSTVAIPVMNMCMTHNASVISVVVTISVVPVMITIVAVIMITIIVAGVAPIPTAIIVVTIVAIAIVISIALSLTIIAVTSFGSFTITFPILSASLRLNLRKANEGQAKHEQINCTLHFHILKGFDSLPSDGRQSECQKQPHCNRNGREEGAAYATIFLS